MNKNLLEIVMPASLLIVAGAIGGCLLLLGGELAQSHVVEVDNGTTPSERGMADSTQSTSTPDQTLVVSGLDPAAVAVGDALFKGNCAQCHAIQDVVVGPAMAGIRQRRPEKWLHTWVKNSSKLIASGDEYAVKIYEQYQKQQMPSFQLSDAEISQIFDYIEAVESQGATVAAN